MASQTVLTTWGHIDSMRIDDLYKEYIVETKYFDANKKSCTCSSTDVNISDRSNGEEASNLSTLKSLETRRRWLSTVSTVRDVSLHFSSASI